MEFIMKLLTQFYHKFSGTKFVNWLAEIYRNGNFISNYVAYIKMKNLSKNRTACHRPIRVVFLGQAPGSWMKIRSIFDGMLEDERYEPLILAIPEDIQNISMKVYEYFRGIYGNAVINAYCENTWRSLKDLNPDCVFYQEPYDNYLPPVYQSGTVVKYVKTLYVPYGFVLWDKVKSISMSKIFFRNVYCYFAENRLNLEYNVARLKKSHQMGYQKSLNIGYPIFETFMKRKPLSDNSQESKVVLWTPRWSEDVGGSNFFNYKDEVIKLPQKYSDLKIIFRPHPLLIDHFIETGRITVEEAKIYLQNFKNNDTLEYDTSNDYMGMFWNVDILLTDVSSIIVEFFLTGKPIIYCDTGVIPDAFFAEVIKGMYVVDNWVEAEKKLDELLQGNDPLKQKREELKKTLFGDDLYNITSNILNEIYKDAMS